MFQPFLKEQSKSAPYFEFPFTVRFLSTYLYSADQVVPFLLLFNLKPPIFFPVLLYASIKTNKVAWACVSLIVTPSSDVIVSETCHKYSSGTVQERVNVNPSFSYSAEAIS